jgi:hypothetical protein
MANDSRRCAGIEEKPDRRDEKRWKRVERRGGWNDVP